MTAQLFRVIFPVHDIEQAARFYAAVFETEGQRVSPGRHYFDCDGVILACYEPVADGDQLGDGWRRHPHQFVYFAVAELEPVLQRFVAAGGEILYEGIATMPWGERLFYGRDPAGGLVSFVDRTTVFRGTPNP